MPEQLPCFRYHPDPVATGAIEPSDARCVCCGGARGYIYSGPVYADEDLDQSLCPWCIADGSAARKFKASFADGYALERAGVSPDVIEEVHLRTPSYSSWQEVEWLSHCGDACEFHGDATSGDVARVSSATKEQWLHHYGQDEETWGLVTKGYVPGGENALYKFRCRHCKSMFLGWDCA